MGDKLKTRQLGAGQVALELDASFVAPVDQLRDLIRLSDPKLSELGFDRLLDELLIRVRDLLSVDTAAILLVDEGTQELVARAARGIEEEVERGVRIPIGGGFAGRIAKERIAISIVDVNHADILNPILREKRIQSLLGVPLIIEGELIGVLHVGSLTRRVFDVRDLAILELAAARAAPAIERGRLLQALAREHRNAMLLQRSLLPRQLPTVGGLTVAARYLPARDEVGGDWYDTIRLSRGKLAVVIGDVVGHGLDAATLMGQLRTAVRAYALEGHGPGRILELLDRFALSLEEEAMATVAVALVDSDSGEIRLASAGHLPPVLIAADGGAQLTDIAPAPPVGALGYDGCPEHPLQLAPGETLLLYTDGLVEEPRTPLSRSLERLVDAVRGSITAEEACLVAMDRLLPGRGPRDDVAVVAVHHDPVPADLDLAVPADPRTLVEVRRNLTRWMRAQEIDQEIAAEVTIAVSEACANAIEHAYGPSRGTFGVRATRSDGVIEVSVADGGHWRAPRGENRGRGLRIMESAMDELEVSADANGTRVTMRRRLR